MNTASLKSPLRDALSKVPDEFRDKIVDSYIDLKIRHREGKHDAAGLSAGKLSESVLRFLQHDLTKTHIPFNKQITNFIDECEKLIRLSHNLGVESIRIVIPRAMIFMYTLRSKRGIGHIGGDVDANVIDGATITRLADWILCELIRVYHNLSLEEADTLINSLSTRNVPDVWEIGGKKRVLRNDLDFKQITLLLLYASVDSVVLAEDIYSWTKYSNLGMYKKSVLIPLHNANLIEYDASTQTVVISPSGIKQVEESII